MSDVDSRSLEYFASQACDAQWRGFLLALSAELNQQMTALELRSFFFLVGKRIADADPLPPGQTLADLEIQANAFFARQRWGWVRVRDLHSSLEFLHSCAPLRQAFGEASMAWAPGLIEGIYASWLKQLGASKQLVLQQIGPPEGAVDTLRFRLAHLGQAL